VKARVIWEHSIPITTGWWRPTPLRGESVVENSDRNTFIPYHPGAVRYYREIGVELAADLVSTR
jgi:TRAP-type uncharacterized transport system substrate-binding protein